VLLQHDFREPCVALRCGLHYANALHRKTIPCSIWPAVWLPFAKMAGFCHTPTLLYLNSDCMPIELSSSAGVHTGNGRMCLESRARCRQQGRFTFAAPVHGAMLPLLCEGQSRSQGVAEHAQECCQPRGFRACCSLANYRLHHAHSELQCHMFCTASKQRCWKQSLNDPEMLMPGVAWFRQLEHCLFLPHAFI
jgi:hypothetical protein